MIWVAWGFGGMEQREMEIWGEGESKLEVGNVEKFKSIKSDSENTWEQGKYLIEHLWANLESWA